MTAATLQADLLRILDRALATGEVIEIERNGQILRIVPPAVKRWVDHLPRREGVVVGDPEELVSIDWSESWRPDPA